MKIVFDIFCTLFDLYLYHMFFREVLIFEHGNRKSFIWTTVVASVLPIITIIFFHGTLWIPLFCAFAIFVVSLYYKCNSIPKILYSFCLFLLLALCETIVGVALSFLSKLTLRSMPENMATYVIGIVVTRLLLLVVIKAIGAFRQHNGESNRSFYLRMLFFPITSLCLMVILILILGDQANPTILILSGIAAVILLASNVMILYLIEKQFETERLKRRFEFIEIQMSLQAQYYSTLYETNRKIQGIRHDYKNNLLSLSGLLQNNEEPQALVFLKKQLDMIDENPAAAYTGLSALDAVLQAKIQQSMERGIQIATKIYIEEDIFIDQMDLSLLIANALDNAIEATDKVKNMHNTIVLTIESLSIGVRIQIENHYLGEPDSKFMRTSKADKENHGFGLQSIRYIVEKYDGVIDIKAEEEFILAALLKNKGME